MIKIVCDKCGAVLKSNNDYYTFNIQGEASPMHFCEQCYNVFNHWVNNNGIFVVDPLFTKDIRNRSKE